jgi:hypothetical protein
MTIARRFILLVVLLALCGGCSTTVIPPKNPHNPVPVYITNYGRHSSLLLRDLRGQTVEFAFGDWDWFALSQKSTSGALRALFASSDSTLGRRQIWIPLGSPPEYVAWRVGAAKVERIDVAMDRSNTLLEQLDAVHEKYISTVTYNPQSDLWFVKYKGDYGLCRNCNHATGSWLRQLGCQIRGPAFWSKFVVENPPK